MSLCEVRSDVKFQTFWHVPKKQPQYQISQKSIQRFPVLSMCLEFDHWCSANELPRKLSKMLYSFKPKSTVECHFTRGFKTLDFVCCTQYIRNMVGACRSTDPVTGMDLLRPEASCPFTAVPAATLPAVTETWHHAIVTHHYWNWLV
jgi:hypothetical protein